MVHLTLLNNITTFRYLLARTARIALHVLWSSSFSSTCATSLQRTSAQQSNCQMSTCSVVRLFCVCVCVGCKTRSRYRLGARNHKLNGIHIGAIWRIQVNDQQRRQIYRYYFIVFLLQGGGIIRHCFLTIIQIMSVQSKLVIGCIVTVQPGSGKIPTTAASQWEVWNTGLQHVCESSGDRPSNTWFLWLRRVYSPNWLTIGSAVLAQHNTQTMLRVASVAIRRVYALCMNDIITMTMMIRMKTLTVSACRRKWIASGFIPAINKKLSCKFRGPRTQKN